MVASFLSSPGVSISEIDLTNRIPNLAIDGAGTVGIFQWGEAEVAKLITSDNDLIATFGKPDVYSNISVLSCSNFLSYGNKLYVVRAINTAARNATANGAGLLIKNNASYEASYSAGQGSVGNWAGKHAGALGNSLKVSICSTATAYNQRVLTGTVSTTGTTVTGVGTSFTTQLTVGDYLVDPSGNKRLIASIASGTSAVLKSAFTVNLSGATCKGEWEFKTLLSSAPSTSDFASARSMVSDECHVVVSDEGGLWTGVQGQPLEIFPFLSLCGNAKNNDGTTNYYAEVVNRQSNYVRWMDHAPAGTNWGATANSTTFTSVAIPVVDKLSGGVDGNVSVSDADKQTAWSKFIPTEVDVTVLFAGVTSTTVANYIIGSVAEVRKDCLVCLAPELADVVNNAGAEVTDSVAFRNTLTSSSYASMVDNWKYMIDRWNDAFVWIPCSSDLAGCIIKTSAERQPWFSPAGETRGQIKNMTKLAYNASATADRDTLYNAGINPVTSFPGKGTILFGDKTLLSKPSAFDRINVRMLFIVLKKLIGSAARSILFELNDDFTRAQFRHLVEPFLKDVKGQRGLYDFRVVCDSTNNTQSVIDRNEFVGDIYLKPSRSINFIRLNFVAVGSGVNFDEVVGQF